MKRFFKGLWARVVGIRDIQTAAEYHTIEMNQTELTLLLRRARLVPWASREVNFSFDPHHRFVVSWKV